MAHVVSFHRRRAVAVNADTDEARKPCVRSARSPLCDTLCQSPRASLRVPFIVTCSHPFATAHTLPACSAFRRRAAMRRAARFATRFLNARSPPLRYYAAIDSRAGLTARSIG